MNQFISMDHCVNHLLLHTQCPVEESLQQITAEFYALSTLQCLSAIRCKLIAIDMQHEHEHSNTYLIED